MPRAEGLFEDNGVAEHKPKVGCACNQATESVIPWSSFSCVAKRRRRCRCLLPHCAVVTALSLSIGVVATIAMTHFVPLRKQ